MGQKLLVVFRREAHVTDHHLVPLHIETVAALESGHLAQGGLDLGNRGLHPVVHRILGSGDLFPRPAVDHMGGGVVIAATANPAERTDDLIETLRMDLLPIQFTDRTGIGHIPITGIDRDKGERDDDREEAPQDPVTNKAVKVIDKHGFTSRLDSCSSRRSENKEPACAKKAGSSR